MADAKGEIYDPISRRLQVSAGMLGYVCKRSGTGLTQTKRGGNTNKSSLLVNVQGLTAPLVALIMDSGAAALYGMDGNGVDLNFASSANVGVGFTYYVFDWTQSLPATSSPFRMLAPDGRVTFDSGYWPMKVTGALGGGGAGTVSAAPGFKLAFACSALGGHSEPISPMCYDTGNPSPDDDLTRCKDIRSRNDGKLYGAATGASGSSVTATNVSVDDVTRSYGSYQEFEKGYGVWQVDNLILIVDVTGIPIGQTFF